MPYLHVQTNANPSKVEQSTFLDAATDAISKILQKNRQYVMAAIETELTLNFASSELPAAFFELKVLGLDPSKNPQLAAQLASLAEVHLHIEPDRIFTRFVDTPRGSWGLGDTVF